MKKTAAVLSAFSLMCTVLTVQSMIPNVSGTGNGNSLGSVISTAGRVAGGGLTLWNCKNIIKDYISLSSKLNLPAFTSATFGNVSLSAEEIKEIYKNCTDDNPENLTIMLDDPANIGFAASTNAFGSPYLIIAPKNTEPYFIPAEKKDKDAITISHSSLLKQVNLQNVSAIIGTLDYAKNQDLKETEKLDKKTKALLAFFLAHEMGHLLKKHTITFTRLSALLGLGMIGLNSIFALKNPQETVNHFGTFTPTTNALAESLCAVIRPFICKWGLQHSSNIILHLANLFGNAHAREYEADALALQFAAEGKIKGISLDEMFEAAQTFFTHPHCISSISGKSHPQPEQRLEALKKVYDKLKKAELESAPSFKKHKNIPKNKTHKARSLVPKKHTQK